MRRIGAEIATGIAIIVAFVIFVGGFLYLKNALSAVEFRLTIRFDDVTGLEPSDFVSISGLRIGKVTSLELQGLEVLVGIEIYEQLQLPKDSKAQVKSLGLVGEKFIDIVPGTSSEILLDGDGIDGTSSGGFSDMTAKVDRFMEKSEKFLADLHRILNDVMAPDARRDLKESLSHARNLTAALDADTKHLEATLVNLESLSANMEELVAQEKEQVRNTIENFNKVSTRANDVTIKIDSTLSTLHSILAKIDGEKGTLGRAINDDGLYDDLRQVTTELDSLVQDFRRRPQRYVNLGFIKIF